MLDPAAATTKWVTNLTASTPSITAGVNAVTQAPGVAAAQQVNTWLAKLTASAPKWQSKVSAVTLQQWQASMINIGIPRIATGAQAKQAKYQAFATKFYPYLATGVAQVKAMPNATLQDGIARAVAMINYNAKYTG